MPASIDAKSYYQASAHPFPPQTRLSGDLTVDVGIIGAGFTGLSAALELAEAGYKVAVLEAREVGYGASGRNGGQICTSPDYLLLPKGKTEDFVAAFRREVDSLYPDVVDNPDFTSIVNERHFARLSGLVEDAKAKGARVVEFGTKQPSDSQSRQFPPVLLLDVTDEMAVMREEIFGPILPVTTYDGLDDAIAYVNARPRPLALYFFGNDAESQRQVLERTTSGGATPSAGRSSASLVERAGEAAPSNLGARRKSETDTDNSSKQCGDERYAPINANIVGPRERARNECEHRPRRPER